MISAEFAYDPRRCIHSAATHITCCCRQSRQQEYVSLRRVGAFHMPFDVEASCIWVDRDAKKTM